MSSPRLARGLAGEVPGRAAAAGTWPFCPDSAPHLPPIPSPSANWAGTGQGAWGGTEGELWLWRVSGYSVDSGIWSPGRALEPDPPPQLRACTGEPGGGLWEVLATLGAPSAADLIR